MNPLMYCCQAALKLDPRFHSDPLTSAQMKHVVASICPFMAASSDKAVKDTPPASHTFTKAENYEQAVNVIIGVVALLNGRINQANNFTPWSLC